MLSKTRGNVKVEIKEIIKRGHFTRDCHGKGVATGANVELIRACFKCGDPNHLANSNLCPERKKQGGRNTSGHVYAVKDAEPRAQTDTLKGCTLNLVNHLFKIDLMPIELGTFDVIIGMDWLVALDAVIVCVISYTKARKYIEIGCHLFLAHVTEKEKSKKRLKDVLVIRDFPEVFPNDLSGLPPSRQVEFKIDLVSGTAPVARAPYRLAPSEMNCLNN
ncbi:hypothetical protein Tco_0884126 [Tanacetum coccineum]